MIGLSEQYQATIANYADPLLAASADRSARYATAPQKKLEPAVRLQKVLSNKKAVSKLVEELSEPEQQTLAILRRSPFIFWRWDHAVRLLAACGVESAYRALQVLLAEGLLCMRPSRPEEPLKRFEVADGLPPEALPSVAIAAPLLECDLELPLPLEPLEGQRSSRGFRQPDGWEFPVRLAILWRLAHRLPIRRTLQNQLFKRDQERIAESKLLTAPMADLPAPVNDAGTLAYGMALASGWLDPRTDEQAPIADLETVWPTELPDLQIECGRAMLAVDNWNELGAATPPGSFLREAPSARMLLLLLLSTLPPDEGVPTDDLAERLEKIHYPWNASGDVLGPLRNPAERSRLAREWVRLCVLGPLFQCGLVSVGETPTRMPLVRLSPLGRIFLGEPRDQVELPPPLAYPQTLLAQPNHDVIVFRQGLSVDLLRKLMRFADPKSVGAALTFELNADSVYHGLEAGLSADEIVSTLEKHGGRTLSSGLVSSIQTWSQKRDRLSVCANASLLEFSEPADLQEALSRGLQGTPINDRMLLVTGDKSAGQQHLRITASRDYSLTAEPCVEPAESGITLRVDMSKSDVMLESELVRFSESLPVKDAAGRRQYIITPESLAKAFEQGLNQEYLEDWFQRRTGKLPPPSVSLLILGAAGARFFARPRTVINFESLSVADGVCQHPETVDLIAERVGDTSVAIRNDQLEAFTAALRRLGIEIKPGE